MSVRLMCCQLDLIWFILDDDDEWVLSACHVSDNSQGALRVGPVESATSA